MPADLLLGALKQVWTALEPMNLPMAVMGGIWKWSPAMMSLASFFKPQSADSDCDTGTCELSSIMTTSKSGRTNAPISAFGKRRA